MDENAIRDVLKEFGLNGDFSHIINGHMPIRAKDGENPIKANGKLIVIDGGLNPIYNPVTGTAGYTLIFNSYGLILAAHEKFISKDNIIDRGKDIMSYYSECDMQGERLNVKDTEEGKKLLYEIDALEELCNLYRIGEAREM